MSSFFWGKGYPNSQIVRQLHLAEGKGKAHVSAVLSKLDAGNRVEAAIIADRTGLI